MKMPLLALLAVTVAHGQTAPANTTLKDAHRGLLRIGVAVNPQEFEGRDAAGNAIIAAQFNTISPENALKC